MDISSAALKSPVALSSWTKPASPLLTALLASRLSGSIAAGQPIPALSSEGDAGAAEFDIVEVRPELKKKHGTLFALSVKGTSMIDALIDDGDVVVITPTNAARIGDMVVAWLKEEEEATLKKFYREGDRVRLQPRQQLHGIPSTPIWATWKCVAVWWKSSASSNPLPIRCHNEGGRVATLPPFLVRLVPAVGQRTVSCHQKWHANRSGEFSTPSLPRPARI